MSMDKPVVVVHFKDGKAEEFVVPEGTNTVPCIMMLGQSGYIAFTDAYGKSVAINFDEVRKVELIPVDHPQHLASVKQAELPGV